MDVNIPHEIAAALDEGAALVSSISGGKDSQAMTLALTRLCSERGWAQPIILHCDLGRMEWRQTPAEVQRQSSGYELVIVEKDHDLLEGIERRMVKRPDAPPFPSAAARYCTAGWKRDTTDQWTRRRWPENATVIVATGLRADESPARAKRPIIRERGSSAPTLHRRVLDWLPIHDWSEADVWAEIGYSIDELQAIRQQWYDTGVMVEGFKAHPAYAMGNQRLSCALCVLASQHDLAIGAENNPELYQALVDIELDSGYAFQNKKPLYKLAPWLLREDQLSRIPTD